MHIELFRMKKANYFFGQKLEILTIVAPKTRTCLSLESVTLLKCGVWLTSIALIRSRCWTNWVICWLQSHSKKAQCTVLQLSKEGWTKLFPHLSWASDHLIMQCFTSLKPLYIVGSVCFGFFGFNLGKNIFLQCFWNRLQNLPFCASKWMVINYIGWIVSNHVQSNYSKSNWS